MHIIMLEAYIHDVKPLSEYHKKTSTLKSYNCNIVQNGVINPKSPIFPHT